MRELDAPARARDTRVRILGKAFAVGSVVHLMEHGARGKWMPMAAQGLLAGWIAAASSSASWAGEVSWLGGGAAWRFLPGTAEASSPDATAWRRVAFSDATWQAGSLPLFYGEALTGTQIQGMQGAYSTYFARARFVVGSLDDVRSVTLRASCDDGFVAWINGKEVARYNMPDGDVGLGSLALGAVPEPAATLEYVVGVPATVLLPGTNVLAVQVFNASLGSSDLVWDARLVADVDDGPPTLSGVVPEPGASVSELASIEVTFSKPVKGVDAGDLRVNGAAATGVTQASQGQYVFTFPPLPPGPVQVGLRGDGGIVDLSPSARPAAGTNWSYTVVPGTLGVRINEFLASNNRGIRDEDGDESDWIEIYNSGARSVSLAGWSLTDDATRLRKWVLPALSVSPGGYAVVWASGKNRTNAAAPLHANFRLADNGEYLALVSPGGQVATAFAPAYPPQRADVSYGFIPGSAAFGYLPTPTPRRANAPGGPGFAPDVVLVPRSRTYTDPIEVRLTISTNDGPVPAGTLVRYTTDGSLPTASSAPWPGVLALTNQAVQVRARAFAPGLLEGRPRSEMYLPLSPTVARFTSDVPVLVIHNFNRGRPPATTRVPAFFQVFEPGTNGIVTFSNAPTLAAAAAISVRGSSTEGLPKASLRVEFQDDFGNDRARSLLGMPEEADWVLYGANQFEPVLIHNPFMHDLSRDIGRYSPRTRLCEVFLVTSGTNAVQYASYNGVYVATERIEIGNDRVDLGSLEPENLAAPAVTGGYMMKVDRLDPGDSGIFAAGLVFGMVEPKESELKDPARVPQFNYLTGYMNAFANALNGSAYADPVVGYRAFVDVPSWIDHHLLNVMAFNVDALRLSAYFGKRRNGLLEFGPLWDFDRALNSTDGRDANPRVWRSTVSDRGTPYFTFPWWDRMFTDLEFWQAYIDRYQELRRGHLATPALLARVDGLANTVRRAAARDWAKWGGSGRVTSYQGEVNLMKNWLGARMDFMDSQFVAPPSFGSVPGRVERGAPVSLTRPTNVTVYYTLDGSDPRARGGGIAPSARAYAGPLTITTNTRVRARSWNSAHKALVGGDNPPLLSVWSGIIDGAFITDLSPLRVSEIHFDPEDGPDGAPQDFEFVELLNTGSRALNLTGCRLSGAVDFVVSPTNAVRALQAGQRCVVVADRASFAARYPSATNVVILGEYSGRLANEGETLLLGGALGETIQSIPYHPSWRRPGALPGTSLVPALERLPVEAYEVAGGWCASAFPMGSPGRVDAASLPVPPVPQVSLDGGSLVLSLTLDAGVAAELQSRAMAASGPWLPVVRHPAGAPRTESLRVPVGDAARFFRWIAVE